MADVITFFWIVSAIITLGVLSEFVFKRTGISDALWLIIAGVLLGPIFHLASPEALWPIIPFFAALTLIIILFQGGLYLDIKDTLKKIPLAFGLALNNFMFSILVVSFALYLLFFFGVINNWSYFNGILLGAILGGTSSVIVMPLAQKIPHIKKELTTLLSLESALTDVLVVVVVIALINFAIFPGANGGLAGILQDITQKFSIGIVIGLLVGIAWLQALKHLFHQENYVYILSFALMIGLYALIESLSGNGAIGVLAFGMVMGNSFFFDKSVKEKYVEKIILTNVNAFHTQISFFIKTFFFVLIGIFLTFNITLTLIALLITFLLAVARVFAVKVSIHKGFEESDKNLITLMMPRGLAAAVMAVLPTTYGLKGGEPFIEITFAVIAFSILFTVIGVFLHIKSQTNEIGKKPSVESKLLQSKNHKH